MPYGVLLSGWTGLPDDNTVYDQMPYGVLLSGWTGLPDDNTVYDQVPYGVLLSGGLDSLLITLCMIRCPMACCCLVDWTPC